MSLPRGCFRLNSLEEWWFVVNPQKSHDKALLTFPQGQTWDINTRYVYHPLPEALEPRNLLIVRV